MPGKLGTDASIGCWSRGGIYRVRSGLHQRASGADIGSAANGGAGQTGSEPARGEPSAIRRSESVDCGQPVCRGGCQTGGERRGIAVRGGSGGFAISNH
jgi:hypothetical protein